MTKCPLSTSATPQKNKRRQAMTPKVSLKYDSETVDNLLEINGEQRRSRDKYESQRNKRAAEKSCSVVF